MAKVSERYAEALFDAATRLGCAEEVADELPAISLLISGCGRYLGDPNISRADKASALREQLSGNICALSMEFVLLLLNRRHIKHFPEASEQFGRLVNAYLDRVTVKLRTPYEPGAELLERLKGRFIEEGLIPENAKDISFDIIEDSDIVGGFIASCNGRQIDTSLRATLVKIRRAQR
ncbi:MAG: F0F1 ATP synthase subunit delta [Oscillospiraceae bacterium]|nr:F0F1 ATP synthase subunit delta [Oscillospiraceae bacterium]